MRSIYTTHKHPLRRGDANIAPAGRTDFIVILDEFGTFQRADVGIGPYAYPGTLHKNP